MLSSKSLLRHTTQTVLFLLMTAASSCTVTRQPVSAIYFPDNTVVEVVSPEMEKLAGQISKRIQMPVEAGTDNVGLYAFVADWLGTPYRFGSMSKRGTDCSGFVYNLYQTVYEGGFNRGSAASIMSKTEKVKKKDLEEGDLVFFNINNRRGGRASHVGVYLKDGYFVHASTSQGVIISSLSEPYYSRHWLSGGRLK